MSFFGSGRYAEIFLGGDEFGLPPGGPKSLTAYQNNISTVVLYWTLSPASPSIHNFVWTIETDTVSTFTSPNLRTYITTDSKITLAGALVTGNDIAVDVDAATVTVPFNTNSNTTLADFAAAIELQPNVASATVVDAGSGTSDDRVIMVRSTNIEAPVVLAAFNVTNGATQTTGTITSSIEFIAGQIYKGAAIPIYTRLQGDVLPMYWRVKGTRGGVDTAVMSSIFDTPRAIDGVTRDAMLDLMPDPIYRKDSSSNNYKTHHVYGYSLDDQYVGDIFADNDIGVASVRDATIQDKFGNLVRIERPQAMKAIDFREIVASFLDEARESPSTESVRDMVIACLGIEPIITPIRNISDIQVADTTLGAEVDEFYIPDDNFYQTITFSAVLVTGNVYSITVDGTPIVTPFNTNSNTTMADIATNLAAAPSIGFVGVVDVAGSDNNRVVVIRAANPLVHPVLLNSVVTGGATQATAAPAAAGAILPPTVWDNVHLSGGVIVEVTNPLGAIVSRAFLEDILRKLIMAHFPLYVIGIP